MKNIMYNFTSEDHRIRLENIRLIEKNLKEVRRKELITYYEPAHYVWPKVRFDNLEEDEAKLKELSEQGVNIIQIWEHFSDFFLPDGTLGDKYESDPHQGEWMYRPYDKELAKKFIDLVHKYGMKILPYTSTNFFVRKSPLFREEWASNAAFDLGARLAHCSALSPGWREQIVRQYATLLDEFDFDGVYIDTGYQRIVDYSEHMPYYDDEVRVASDEVLAFTETREHDGGMQDLLGLIYGECRKRGKILKLHKEGFDTVRSDFKIYDYLWVGEAVESINHIREHSKDYDAYIVPDFNYKIDDAERYLNTIPFMQFPIMRDAKMGIGDPRAGVPDFELMCKWLKLYKTMTSYGTWAYIDVNIPKVVKTDGEDTVVTAFINRDLYVVVANYSYDEGDTIILKKSFNEVDVDGKETEIGNIITLLPRQMKIFKLNTPEEWKEAKVNKTGISEEALLG